MDISKPLKVKRRAIVAPLLVGVNFLVYAYQFYIEFRGGSGALEELFAEFALIPARILTGEGLHALLTHMFLHGSFFHLLFNCIPLFFFGSFLEKDIGSPRFTVIYFTSGVVGGFVYLIAEGLRSPFVPVLGASGAIFGVVGTVTLLHPFKFAWSLLFPFPVVLFSAIYILVATALVIGGYIGYIAHSAHLGGLIYGMLLAFAIRPTRALIGLIILSIVLAGVLLLFLWLL